MAEGSDYTFNGWYKGAYPNASPFNKNSTITQNVTEETWYYAEFSPPKTVIPALTFTSDMVPVAGMTRADLPTVTVKEEGVNIVGRSWVDMSGDHISEDHVFALGEQLQLHIDYNVDKE